MLASFRQSKFVDKNVRLLYIISNKKLVYVAINVYGTYDTEYQVQRTGTAVRCLFLA